jgi:Uma2 family endonuclease
MTKLPSHVLSTRKARRALERIVPDGWFTDSQEPISTATSEPEPDVVVIRGMIDDYGDRHAEPGDVGLIVEVADSSLERDRVWKQRIYAAAKIPCYWIINLIDRQIEVCTSPTGSGESASYASQQIFRPGEQIVVELDESEVGSVAVVALLP